MRLKTPTETRDIDARLSLVQRMSGESTSRKSACVEAHARSPPFRQRQLTAPVRTLQAGKPSQRSHTALRHRISS